MVDERFESGEWEVLVDDLDPLKRTESTTQKVGEKGDVYLADNAKIKLTQFHARCYCEAAIKSNEAQGLGRYDLFFCKEDKANGDEVCPHFEELNNAD